MSSSPAALDIKSANLYALRAVLREADPAALREALAHHMARAGSLFEDEPVVIDASFLPDDTPLDWADLVQALRAHKLPPIGAVATDAQRADALAAGLTPLELSTASAPVRAKATKTQTTGAAKPEVAQTATAEPAQNLLITRPLRSGQRIYARGGDLTIVGMVSPGAEILADGNIHVYGPLRGKAMAGARGNNNARIFSTQFDPELVAIAGIYQVVEQKLDATLANRPVQVWLADDRLRTEAL